MFRISNDRTRRTCQQVTTQLRVEKTGLTEIKEQVLQSRALFTEMVDDGINQLSNFQKSFTHSTWICIYYQSLYLLPVAVLAVNSCISWLLVRFAIHHRQCIAIYQEFQRMLPSILVWRRLSETWKKLMQVWAANCRQQIPSWKTLISLIWNWKKWRLMKWKRQGVLKVPMSGQLSRLYSLASSPFFHYFPVGRSYCRSPAFAINPRWPPGSAGES